jgi:multidrug efflux system outer membrane protein
MRFNRTVLPLSLAALLAACASAPPPQAPTVQAPDRFAQAASTQAAEPVAQFWRAFGDADLDALIAQALDANRDLRVAAARVAEARALARVTDSYGKPTLDLAAGASRRRALDDGGVSRTNSSFDVGLAASWELDLLGDNSRVGNERRAAQAQVLAAEAQRRAAQVSVAAEVARSYFELRGLQEQLRVTSLDLGTQRQALKLVEARLDAGRGTALDTERARVLVEGTAASLPLLESQLARTRMRLAVLTGASPAALDTRLAEQKPLPGLPATPLATIGTPQTLFQRRPDVAAAEQQLRAAEAQTGIARSRLYPSITLTGGLGLNAGRIGDLGDSNSFVANLGASLLWSLIDQGARRAQVSAAEARRDAALATFDQTLLAALEETEGAFVAFNRNQERSERLFAAAKAAEGAARIARARFEVGTIDFLALLDAERELLQARDRLAQGQTGTAVALVGVYRALAGGWQ